MYEFVRFSTICCRTCGVGVRGGFSWELLLWQSCLVHTNFWTGFQFHKKPLTYKESGAHLLWYKTDVQIIKCRITLNKRTKVCKSTNCNLRFFGKPKLVLIPHWRKPFYASLFLRVWYVFLCLLEYRGVSFATRWCQNQLISIVSRVSGAVWMRKAVCMTHRVSAYVQHTKSLIWYSISTRL